MKQTKLSKSVTNQLLQLEEQSVNAGSILTLFSVLSSLGLFFASGGADLGAALAIVYLLIPGTFVLFLVSIGLYFSYKTACKQNGVAPRDNAINAFKVSMVASATVPVSFLALMFVVPYID